LNYWEGNPLDYKIIFKKWIFVYKDKYWVQD